MYKQDRSRRPILLNRLGVEFLRRGRLKRVQFALGVPSGRRSDSREVATDDPNPLTSLRDVCTCSSLLVSYSLPVVFFWAAVLCVGASSSVDVTHKVARTP